MILNLNKKYLTKENLLKHIDDWTIYNKYSNTPLEIKKVTNSPLRTDEKPSFALFIGETGEICFNDFVLGKGDFVKFVQLKFGLNYLEALSKIVIDFQLEENFINVKPLFKTKLNEGSNKTRQQIIKDLVRYPLKKKARSWEMHDLSFWNNYGISLNTLKFFNVEPISYIFIGDKIIKADKYAYCFTETKDDVVTYKIYQPFNKNYKWLNNHDVSVWQGWNQLPNKNNEREYDGKILIITKSLKDVMSIYETCDLPAIALQSENAFPKQHIIDILKERFENIFVLYDNDYDKEINWGKEFASELSDKFELYQIDIETFYKSKDFSDLVKNHGKTIAKEYLIKQINLIK